MIETDDGPSIEEQMARDLLSPEERNTVLAALRLWQDFREGMPPDEPMLKEIATNNGAHPMMTTDAVDELCERLNR